MSKMSLKRKNNGQSVTEYIVLFVALTVGVIFVFGGFNLNKGSVSTNGVVPVFKNAVDGAVGHIENLGKPKQ